MITQEQLEKILNLIDEVQRYKWNGHAYDCTCPLAAWRHEKKVDRHPSAFITNTKTEKYGGASYKINGWFFYCNSCGTALGLFNLIAELNIKCHGKYSEIEKYVALNEEDDIYTKMDNIISGALLPTKTTQANTDDVIFSDDELAEYIGKVPEYAVQRISLDSCREWELGYDVPRQRLVFPLRRWPDRGLVGLIGRTILSKNARDILEKTTDRVIPKYYNYWSFERSLYMYGEHKIDAAYGKVILVEGPMDVISGYEAGYKNVVAVLGSRITVSQAEKLCIWDMPVTIMPDPDKKLLKSARRELSNKLLLKEAKLPVDKDPGELSCKEFKVAVDTASIVF